MYVCKCADVPEFFLLFLMLPMTVIIHRRQFSSSFAIPLRQPHALCVFPFFLFFRLFPFPLLSLSLSLSLLTNVCVVRLRRWQILYQLHIHSIEAELKSFLSFERKIDNQKKKELVRLVVVLVVSRFGCLWPYFMFR